ncbi:MAG: FlgD immunoglobulin-like domain containing protein [Gemmatimonadota bacterium]|nr:FlgD immunoglobulin-like domain containing protein [Gemmatimonadota bacterium]
MELLLDVHVGDAQPGPERDVAEHLDVVAPALDDLDLRGRRVREMVVRAAGPGAVSVLWDGRDAGGRRAASGVYFVRASSGRWSVTGKLVRRE